MEISWLLVSLLLCAFGFLKEIRPSEPFIYEFLIGPWRNVTEEQITQQVYPAGTYSYLALLVVVFLITDLARYKPLIVFSGLCGIVGWSLLLWTTSLRDLLILEVFYGSFMACEVAYYTYIYAKVDKRYYQQVTSHTRAAILGGRTISGILGQLLISLNVMDFRQLNYITLGALSVATFWSLFLPPVKKSIYFHQETSLPLSKTKKTKQAFNTMIQHLKRGYSNAHTVKWSIWWSLATCGFVQVQTYIQTLWSAIVGDQDYTQYNGAVEAVLTLTGFLGALIVGFLRVNWSTWGEVVLTCCSLIQGTLMMVSAQTDYIVVSYVCYVVFGASFHFMITIASSEIATFIEEDSYGLIFGINTFAALSFQTILMVVVVTGDIGFGLQPRGQFLVYGGYHLVLGLIFLIIAVYNRISSAREQVIESKAFDAS
ncbi:thiamine transporter 2-like [Euwallacea fornicatus]|uniref:thiamine transporter 2-like n=1 Tax=Euwallacea fornicatus TaxID=995702 RepID=UPI00338F8BBC